MPKETIDCTLEDLENGTSELTELERLSRKVVVNWAKKPGDEGRCGVFIGVVDQDEQRIHAEMTRPEINRLIRVLRRARDSAFGADA